MTGHVFSYLEKHGLSPVVPVLTCDRAEIPKKFEIPGTKIPGKIRKIPPKIPGTPWKNSGDMEKFRGKIPGTPYLIIDKSPADRKSGSSGESVGKMSIENIFLKEKNKCIQSDRRLISRSPAKDPVKEDRMHIKTLLNYVTKFKGFVYHWQVFWRYFVSNSGIPPELLTEFLTRPWLMR